MIDDVAAPRLGVFESTTLVLCYHRSPQAGVFSFIHAAHTATARVPGVVCLRSWCQLVPVTTHQCQLKPNQLPAIAIRYTICLVNQGG